MPSRPGEQRTGRLLVVLTQQAVDRIAERTDTLHATDLGSLGQLGDELGYPALQEVVERHAERSFPVVRSLSTSRILALDHIAREGPFPPSRSMAAYWLAVPARREDAAARLFRGLLDVPAAVEAVYLEQAVGPPPVKWIDDDYAGSQTHLEPARAGVDAKWVWDALGLDGAGVGFTDVERGWNLTHNDLKAKMPAGLISHLNHPNYRDHGTAVLGLVVGVDNTEGIVGIAPGVSVVRLASHWDGASAENVADAIETAADAMALGDVLLLETQTGYDGPIETMAGGAELVAIQTAASKGIVVIEAAGNAGEDLDTEYPDMLTVDSGAILVGASQGHVGVVSHARRTSSNYGSRIDCFAPGVDLISAGYGDLDPGGGDENLEYTKAFRDTSGASAIVAGAALLAQHMHVAACGTRLDSLEMRELLKSGGTEQGATDGYIGIMPDLRGLARTLCDVYLRDFVGDTGTVPSTGPLSSSPDIIVLPSPVPNAQLSFGQGSGTENSDTLSQVVAVGRNHVVYVRLRNRGKCPAAGATATVYWSEVATLVTPGAWHPIGKSAPVTVPPGDILTTTAAIPWPAAKGPTTAGHYCFVATVDHPYDPSPPQPSATDWAGFLSFLRQSNNVSWRNFNVLDPEDFAVDTGAWFEMRGAPDEPRSFDFEIESRFPSHAPLFLEVPLQLLPAVRGGRLTKVLRIEADRVVIALPPFPSIRMPSVRLGKDAKFRCRFFVAGTGERLAVEHASLVIRQLYLGTEVGRITWVLRSRDTARRDSG